jgi:hypothetical protein
MNAHGRRCAAKTAVSAWLGSVVVAMLLAAANTATAAPCAGFTDVDDTSTFCPSVEWLRNRTVTVGCTNTTVFCPFDSVNRLSMAAFMNRLGIAMTPRVVYAENGSTGLDLDSPPAALCSTSTAGGIAVTDFPRRVAVNAVFSARTSSVTAHADLRLVMRINGGAWTPLTPHPVFIGGTSEWLNAALHRVDVPLDVGNSYDFGLAATRSSAPASTGDLQSWTCQVEAVVYSRTGASAPF